MNISKLKNIARILQFSIIGFAASSPLPSSAQMQIPNPLVQPPPRKALAQKDDVKEPLPPMASQQGMPRGGQEMGFPQQPGGMNAANPSGTGKTPFTEVRERLAPFYVSAIVGDRAILRRAAVSTAGTVPNNPGIGIPGMPAAMAGAISTAVQRPVSSQTETMTVTDGEPIDFIGDGITLTPKVTSSRVSIYYSEDGTAHRKSGKRQVVFIGQVESTAAGTPTPIILEKSDPTYRQKVSVETKSRSSNGSNQSSGSGVQPQPNVMQ